MNTEIKKRPRFSWVDWLLVALLLLVFFGSGFYFYTKLQAGKNQAVRVVYKVLVPNVEWDMSEDVIAQGMRVTSENGTAILGEILAVESRPHREAIVQKNKLIMAEVPNRKDLYILIEGVGEALANEGLRIHDIRIAAGGFYNLRLGAYFAANCQIISVEKGDVD